MKTEVLRNIEVPTGNILIVQGDLGKLECLSLSDYGKEVNVKADFMGLSRNIERVTHTSLLPLSEKWVVTISTQYGCSMGYKFCDVPKVGPGFNATYNDLLGQILAATDLHQRVRSTKRLNIHYARMGEPTWNDEVYNLSSILYQELGDRFDDVLIYPVVSTMMPRHNEKLEKFLIDWMDLKNGYYKGDAGLQISLNSTNDTERRDMFSGNAMTIDDVSRLCRNLPKPAGRKVTLNFAVAGYEIDAEKLRDLFDPGRFLIKLTPMHKTESAIMNSIETLGDYTTIYPYLGIESSLKRVGFDVLVFVASEYEDLGRITCGNAILSGSVPECPHIEAN